jgi:hypothetical protein
MGKDKRLPFEKEFVSLGIMVNFNGCREKRIAVKNKPGRLEGIRKLVNQVFAEDYMGFKESLSLRGKFAYAEGQLFSRVAAPACRLLSRWASVGFKRKLTDEVKLAISVGCTSLFNAKPKVVLPACADRPVCIFTDGACEPEGSSIGGVIFDGSQAPELFGAMLSKSVVDSWCTKLGQSQVIGQAELFPLLVARHTWRHKLIGRRVIYFIDNDSARMGMVKAYSPVLPSLDIICKCLSWDNENESVSWYARVPTVCNIADDPSRMCPDLLVGRYGAKIVAPLYDDLSVFTDIL